MQVAALKGYLEMQIESSTYSTSIVGFPLETPPTTKQIGLFLLNLLTYSLRLTDRA